MQRRAFEVSVGMNEPVDGEDEPFQLASNLAVPTSVIVGELDLDTCHDAAQRWSAALPFVELEVWDQTAHLVSMEQPERFNQRLLAWLAQVAC